MHAVSSSSTRSAGMTSFDVVAAVDLGKLGLTARPLRRGLDWLGALPSARIRRSRRHRTHPSAGGHGHPS